MKIFRNPDVMWREESGFKEKALQGLEEGDDVEDLGTSVLYSGSTVLSLNILGTEIWKLCDGRTIDDIVSELLTSFEVDHEVLYKDVTMFLDELHKKGYVYHEE